jgi:hypothetical protein
MSNPGSKQRKAKKTIYIIVSILTLSILSALFISYSYIKKINYTGPLKITVAGGLQHQSIRIIGITPRDMEETILPSASGEWSTGYRLYRCLRVSADSDSALKGCEIKFQTGDTIHFLQISQLTEVENQKHCYEFPRLTYENPSLARIARSFYKSPLSEWLLDKILPWLYALLAVMISLYLANYVRRKKLKLRESILLLKRVMRSCPEKIKINFQQMWHEIRGKTLAFSALLMLSIALPLLTDKLLGLCLPQKFDTSGFHFYFVSALVFFSYSLLLLYHRALRINKYFLVSAGLIFTGIYFVTAPFVYLGNYGFCHAFNDYATNVTTRSFLHNLVTLDTTYLALLQRLVYSLHHKVFGITQNLHAAVGITEVIFISLCISFMCLKRFRSIILSDTSRFLTAAGIGLFSAFSVRLVPWEFHHLPDYPYFGLFFCLFVFFLDFRNIRILPYLLLLLFSCVLMMSKIQFIVFLPIFFITTIYSIKSSQNKFLWFSLLSFAALIIQLVIVLSNKPEAVTAMAFDAEYGAYKTSFAIHDFSLHEWIVTASYYLMRSYRYIFFQSHLNYGLWIPVTNILASLFLALLVILSFRKIIKGTNTRRHYFILLCLAISMASAMLFLKTAGMNAIMDDDTTLIEKDISELFFASSYLPSHDRYTFFIHIPAFLATLSFLLHYVPRFPLLQKRIRAGITSGIITSLFLLMSLTSHIGFIPDTGFWFATRNDGWDREWRALSAEMKQKQYYIPSYNYPAHKRIVHYRLSRLFDSGPGVADTLRIRGGEQWDVHGMLTLNHPDYFGQYRKLIRAAGIDSSGKTVAHAELTYNLPQMKYLHFKFDKPSSFRYIVLYDETGIRLPFKGSVRLFGKDKSGLIK